MQVFAGLWVLAAVGFVVAVVGLARNTEWWMPVLVVVALTSLGLTVADWRNARVGAIVDAVILMALAARWVLMSAHP